MTLQRLAKCENCGSIKNVKFIQKADVDLCKKCCKALQTITETQRLDWMLENKATAGGRNPRNFICGYGQGFFRTARLAVDDCIINDRRVEIKKKNLRRK